MLDTRGVKNVLSAYKNIRALSLDFGIAKGAIDPGNNKIILHLTQPGYSASSHLVLYFVTAHAWSS